LDWTPSGEEGRIRRLQEEYVEWRVVRDDVGIRRVELTTELSDYWRQEKRRAAKRRFFSKQIDSSSPSPRASGKVWRLSPKGSGCLSSDA
jgi:hypothetical protein